MLWIISKWKWIKWFTRICGNLIYGHIQFILLRSFEIFLGEPRAIPDFPLAGAIMGHHFRTGTPGFPRKFTLVFKFRCAHLYEREILRFFMFRNKSISLRFSWKLIIWLMKISCLYHIIFKYKYLYLLCIYRITRNTKTKISVSSWNLIQENIFN